MSTRKHPIVAVSLLALLILSALASPALAAPTAPWASIDVRWILASGGVPAVLVSGDLPVSATLPASVQLGVPKGTRVSWAGEIVGTDPSKDPAVQYTTVQGKNYDRIDFTLSRARRGQVEYDAAGSLGTNGSRKTVLLTWTSPFDAAAVNLTVQPPSGATVSDAGGGSPGPGGLSYTKRFTSVKVGQELKLQVAYSGGIVPPAGKAPGQTGAAAAPSSGGGSGSAYVLPIIVLVILLGGTFFLLKNVRARQADAEAEADEDYDEEEDEEPEPERPAPTRARARTPDRDDEDDGAFEFDDDEPVVANKSPRSGTRGTAAAGKTPARAAATKTTATGSRASRPKTTSAAKPKTTAAKTTRAAKPKAAGAEAGAGAESNTAAPKRTRAAKPKASPSKPGDETEPAA